MTDPSIDPATQRMLGDSVMHDAEPEPEPDATPIADLETAARPRAAYAGYTP